jgi:hypothetical protein
VEKARGAVGVAERKRAVRSVRSIGARALVLFEGSRWPARDCYFDGVSSEVVTGLRGDVTARLAEVGKKLWPAPPFRGSPDSR